MARVANPSPAVQKHVDKVVAEFIAGLAKGQIPWAKPWRTFGRPMPYNGSTGKDYRGINAIALQMRSGTNEFWTQKQAEKLGGKLVDRSRRCDVIFQAPMDGNKIMDEDADEEEATGFLSTVFAAYPREAFEGLPPSKYAGPPPPPVDSEGHKRSPHVEAAIKATRAKVKEIQSDQAFYSPSQDVVVVPLIGQFTSAESYYGTLWHELTHWSGGPKRLKREFGKTFGDDKYAFEELVAELGAVFCCTALGIQVDQIHHQSYINGWISRMKSQPTYLMRAAALASQALEFLLPDLHKPIKVAKPKAEPKPKATAKPKAGPKPKAGKFAGYKYGLMLRPGFGAGAPPNMLSYDPQGLAGAVRSESDRHGIATYRAELKDEDLWHYSMVPIGNARYVDRYAAKMWSKLERYAANYLRMGANALPEQIERLSSDFGPITPQDFAKVTAIVVAKAKKAAK